MKKTMKNLGTGLSAAGKKISTDSDGCVKLPVDLKQGQEVLFMQRDGGYRVIPLAPDVKRLYIEVTTKCNFDCITCIRSTWEDKLLHMDWPTFEKILASLDGLPQLESVHFGGFGEPMMHPRILDMLRAVKGRGLKTEMITNGSYLTEENAQKLIDLELDVLFTSLDSPDEQEYNEIRQGADFQSVFKNVAKLQAMKQAQKAVKPELGIEFVAMRKNFTKLPKLIRLAWELNAAKVIVSNLLPYHESMKDEIVYDIDDSGPLFKDRSFAAAARASISHMKLRTERQCKFVKDKSMSINYQGNVSPCYALMHTYQCYVYGRKKQIYPCYLGNVNEKTLGDIWMEPGFVEFRQNVEEFRFPSCTDCKSLDGCNYTESNEMDCWGNTPSCAECLWARRIIACP